MSATTYAVTGMSCEHCAQAVSTELAGLHGVSSVSVELSPGGVSRVTVTSDAPLPAAAVSGALDEAGGYQIADA
jgi:copper chaperone CopZ